MIRKIYRSELHEVIDDVHSLSKKEKRTDLFQRKAKNWQLILRRSLVTLHVFIDIIDYPDSRHVTIISGMTRVSHVLRSRSWRTPIRDQTSRHHFSRIRHTQKYVIEDPRPTLTRTRESVSLLPYGNHVDVFRQLINCMRKKLDSSELNRQKTFRNRNPSLSIKKIMSVGMDLRGRGRPEDDARTSVVFWRDACRDTSSLAWNDTVFAKKKKNKYKYETDKKELDFMSKAE